MNFPWTYLRTSVLLALIPFTLMTAVSLDMVRTAALLQILVIIALSALLDPGQTILGTSYLVLGPRHRYTLACMRSHLKHLIDDERLHEACELGCTAWALHVQVKGFQHPTTCMLGHVIVRLIPRVHAEYIAMLNALIVIGQEG